MLFLSPRVDSGCQKEGGGQDPSPPWLPGVVTRVSHQSVTIPSSDLVTRKRKEKQTQKSVKGRVWEDLLVLNVPKAFKI